MKTSFLKYALLPALCWLAFLRVTGQPKQSKIEFWLTNSDKSALFQKQSELTFRKMSKTSPAIESPVISINPKRKYQEIDGFGFTLTGGSAGHLMAMSKTARAALLKELFSTAGNGIGMGYLRVSIGASDLNERVFSYNDLPQGQTDPELKHFNLGPDRHDVIPVLKEILSINPKLKILGSPWSPPVWMKDNGDTRGGSLKPEWYDAYAKYLVRYIQDMQKEGIRIDAITVQNEPLHPGNNPSLLMLAKDQAVFVKNHLGPAFEKAKIDTKIIVYDHNADKPEYPISILDDPEAKKYVDGSAFHLYGGTIDALSKVHDAHPDKNLYFTEQWMGAPGNFGKDFPNHIKNLTIGATQNWARTVLEWNLTSNPENRPFTDRGGCDRCLGGVTIDGDKVTRNAAYYVVAHASKFVRPGSVRIASGAAVGDKPDEKLPNVAFVTPEGKKVLIVLNDSDAEKKFSIQDGENAAYVSLKAGSVGTFVW
ncbi:glucosylceramidase [Dyadobacter sp. CY261]|uniref:glycoside hydrolase family 30 protein n=1 Tax=Dyadobacter sp. CY261 TaxID=2907203 RepID=UPI001F18BADC|nr:glycoside hydrolase family 30 beta sandwich domain-containing protein [Dyadobacter sp. CY261]MCF0069157.1 glucosylceramidase [Dyadobacter sp. CY261]